VGDNALFVLLALNEKNFKIKIFIRGFTNQTIIPHHLPSGGVFCAYKIEFTGVYRIGSCIQIADRDNTEILAYSA
jgi:hypothetical protein